MPALHDFIAAQNDIEGLRELLRRGENPNIKDRLGRTPLHIAVLKCERNPQDTDEILQVVRELINFGANVNLGNNAKSIPLHEATLCRNYKMMEILLQANSDVNKKDQNGCSALHFATSISRFRSRFRYDLDLRVVKLLLKYDPDVDTRNCRSETPLLLATQRNNLYIVRELLRKNASVNLKYSDGYSAMHYALNDTEADVNVVFELRRHGCTFNLKNHFGETPKNYFLSGLIRNHPHAVVEKAKHAIKLFMLDKYSFISSENRCITKINKNKNCQLSRFLVLSYNEIMQMHRDKLSSHYSVYNIALRGMDCRAFEYTNHTPLEVFDKVLDKLIRRQYPAYYDVIAAGICRPYINLKFAEMCCNIETGYKFWDFHVLYLVSFYLSNLDMLNMMIACYEEARRSRFLPHFVHSTRCSIS